nr:extensin-1-like isoform X40 [Rhipicephalus microplus]
MKFVFGVAVLVTIVALTAATKGKHGKGKTNVVVVDAYPERRPVYDYPAPRPSYAYQPTYAKHVEKTYRQYREPVYYDAPKKERPITSVLVLITDLHIKVVNQTPKKVKEAYPVPVEVPVYRDRIQKVPVYQHVPYPVYIQPQRHYAPPRKSLKRVYYHSPKQVYHHPPRPVYQQARPYGR